MFVKNFIIDDFSLLDMVKSIQNLDANWGRSLVVQAQ